ncbi:MAG TPA: DinB family protein [Gemmatimonadales bacterium]|nr:DinB family protein [Gemmatimonadales bacterium]
MADWATLVARHSAAVEEFLRAAHEVGPVRWLQPSAPGKWSPAEITSHLTESYRTFRTELAGGPGMGIRLGPLRRWVLRRTVLPRILSTGIFPNGARAPRETRPREVQPEPRIALHALSTEADAMVQELSDRMRSDRVRLTHAYFGRMSAQQGLTLAIVHTRHHARQIAAVTQA